MFKETLTALAASTLIFLGGGGLANADEKKANLQEKAQSCTQEISNAEDIEEWDEINEYDSFDDSYDFIEDTAAYKPKEKKAKPYIDPCKKNNDKWKKWLPKIEVAGEIAPFTNTNQYETVREELLDGGYENWGGVITSREYKGSKKDISLSIKQPIPNALLNLEISKIDESGQYNKWQDYLEDKDFDSWLGTYNRNLLKLKAFISKEFEISTKNKKIILEPKIGAVICDESIIGDINLNDYDYTVWDWEEEKWNGIGPLIGLKVKNKDKSLEWGFDYSSTNGKNISIWKDCSFTRYWFVATSEVEGDLKTRNLNLSLNYKPAAKKESFFKNTKIGISGDITENKIYNTGKDDWGYDNWRDFTHTCLRYGLNFEKELKKNLSAGLGISGIINLGSSGDVIYRKTSPPEINAKIKYGIDFSKIFK